MGKLVKPASDLTTGKPTVIFGTKCPSITSTCNTPAPPRSTALIWSPRHEKSADKIDGAMSMWRSLFTTYWFGFGVGRGTGRLLFTAAGRVFAFGGAIRFTLLRGVAFTFAAPVFVFARLTLARF